MRPDADESTTLTCPGCGGRFRLTPKQGRDLPEAVPCPTCETRIPVERRSEENFWVSRSYAEIFHRNPALAAPTSEATGDEHEPRGEGGVHRTSRTFRDVRDVRRERDGLLRSGEQAGNGGGAEARRRPGGSMPPPESAGSRGAQPEEADRDPATSLGGDEPQARDSTRGGGAPETDPPGEHEAEFEEVDREAASADLDELERELSFVAAEAAEDVSGTPLPLPVEQPSKPEADLPGASSEAPGAGGAQEGREGAHSRADGEPVDEAESEQTPGASRPEPPPIEGDGAEGRAEDGGRTGDGEVDPRPAEELFEEWEETVGGEFDDEQTRYDVRVDDTVRRDVGLRRLVEMIKRGVWSRAVEIREGDEWVPLRQHDAIDRIKGYLLGQSRQILLEEAPPEFDQRESAAPEPAGEAETGPDAAPEDRRGGRVTWLAIVFAVVAGIAAAAALGVYVLAAARGGAAAAGRFAGPRGGGAGGGAAGAGEVGVMTITSHEPDGRSSGQGGEAVAAAGEAVEGALSAPRQARKMLEAGHPEQARRLAVDGMVRRGLDRQLQKIFDASIERDDDLPADPVTIGDDVEVDAIRALGGGWSISFRLTEEEESKYAFKPTQRHWEEGWRAEVAAYRLCEIIACHFEIPRNRPARVSRETFETLYGEVDNEDQAAYERRFDDLKWREERGPDGVERQYLYGTLKDWVPEFAKWPIEYEDVWHPWVDAGADPSRLDRPLEEAISAYRQRGQENFYRELIDERGEATTRSVARQLSTILAFDFLVSNWDRYSTAESYFGVNNQFADGRFVSIDNGAAFPAHHFRVVSRRLQPVTRFSRETVATIRALRREVVDPVLFPDPSVKEQSRLDVFWQQRDRFLDRINGLVAEYGRESVLYFR